MGRDLFPNVAPTGILLLNDGCLLRLLPVVHAFPSPLFFFVFFSPFSFLKNTIDCEASRWPWPSRPTRLDPLIEAVGLANRVG